MKDYLELIDRTAKENYETVCRMYNDANTKKLILDLSNHIIDILGKGQKVLVAGNGGSAADAQHFVAELVSKYQLERKPLRAIALTTDTSVITSIGNDYGFENLFSRQIEALGDKGDIFIGITTSGKSKNILEAIKKAKEKGMMTSCLSGKNGVGLAQACDIVIKVPSKSVPRIQEMHSLIIHQICEITEGEI